MKKYLLIFLSISGFYFNSVEAANVKFEVSTIDLNAGAIVHITGNDEQLGNWRPDAVQLEKMEEGKWTKSFSFDLGRKIEFKFTLGSWDTEALNIDGSIPPNFILEVLNDTTVKIKIDRWADQFKREVESQITGTLKYHKNFHGIGIKARDIIVWLPPGYETDSNTNYPVLYMHDGQNIVDPKTSAFQVDWQIDETADSLIRNNFMEPIIIVGIYNSKDREKEYSDDSLGFTYMNFITDSLKPFIDRNYRTKSNRENTANGGASLGGLISFILVWEHPDVFSKAICFSPAFKIDNYNFVDDVTAYRGEKKNIEVFINNGDNELDTELQTGVDEMINALILQGYILGKDFYLFKDKNSQHSERGWSKSIWRALITLFGTEKGRELL